MATREQLIEDFADHKLATGEKFVRLINSTKAVQEPVADPAASGTSLSFIDSITQDADGKITATKKTLDLANAHELNPFKGWYKTGDTLPTDGFDGAYLYFKDTSELTGQTTIYRWNGTTYADTGTVVDTSNVQTFETGQAVNGVKIKNLQGTSPANPTLPVLEDVEALGQVATDLTDRKQEERSEVNITDANQIYELGLYAAITTGIGGIIAENKTITKVKIFVRSYGTTGFVNSVLLRLRKDNRSGNILAQKEINEQIPSTVDNYILWTLDNPISYNSYIYLEIQLKGEATNSSGKYYKIKTFSDGGSVTAALLNQYKFPTTQNDVGFYPDRSITPVDGTFDIDYEWHDKLQATSSVSTRRIPYVEVFYNVDRNELRDDTVAERNILNEAVTKDKLNVEVKNLLNPEVYSSILSLNSREEVMSALNSFKRSNLSSSGEESTTPHTLLHFSDIHGSTANLQRIVEFYQKYKSVNSQSYIDDAICTGDIVTFSIQDGLSFWEEAGADAAKILMVMGNHDVSNGNGFAFDNDIYNTFIASRVSSWGIIQPAGAGENNYYPCYYYKDYGDLRLIVLDVTGGDVGLGRFDATQQSWLQGILSDAISADKHVLIATHYVGSKVNKGIDNPFNSQDLSSIGDNYSGYTRVDGLYCPMSLDTIIDNFISNGGHFVCYIGGHIHRDVSGLITQPIGAYNQYDHSTTKVVKRLTICIDCAANRDSIFAGRMDGERSQDIFNIYSVDTERKILKVKRFGRDRDIYARHIDTMCWDYENCRFIESGTESIKFGVTFYPALSSDAALIAANPTTLTNNPDAVLANRIDDKHRPVNYAPYTIHITPLQGKTIQVFMNSEDITSTAFDSTLNKVHIECVTGDIVIKEVSSTQNEE